MMVHLGYIFAATGFAALGAAAPVAPRDVTTAALQQLTLFAEYSAAAYCTSNVDSTGTKLTCSSGNCPLVEQADTITLSEFNESESFGDVAGFLAADKTNKLIVLSFRGSRTLDNWIANLDFVKTDVDLCSGCEAHGGFWKSWQVVAATVTAGIKSALTTYPGYTVVVTGHSLGGALATLSAADLRNAGIPALSYTYGSPRVGNEALADYITGQGSNYRVTHTNDIVPRLPPSIFGFTHISPEYWITSGNDVTVTTADIEVIQGVGSSAGNAGESSESTDAHSWYIIEIAACQ